ncbi:MAG TPA: lytic transglycosylase domain-containing protein [Blastocatellia bacterium]|nr:lytic transglycosylase domain-containing protein [Blastocatellia bacterium]
MLKYFAPLLFVALVPAWTLAQSRPLSPPDQSPIPLSDTDQERARAAELAPKTAPAVQPGHPAIQIPVPGRHLSTGNAAIDTLVYEAAARYNIDPCLIISVMGAESAYNRMAVSPKGASGLMQLMPATAARLGVKNIFDPRENVMAGANYLHWLLDRFGGDVRLALAGYNAGEGAVELYGNRIPPFLETQNYVQTIYTRYSRVHGTSPATVHAPAPAAVTPLTVAAADKAPTYNQIIRFTSSNGEQAAAGR